MLIRKELRFLEILIFALVLTLFVIKLDRYYFFTDEILYVQKGIEHFQGNYTGTLQVPPLPKYFAGLMFNLSGGDLGLMRLPYALMSVSTAYLVFVVLKRQFNSLYGLVGVLLFVSSRIIFDASRMVMLEPLMHLFWMLFLYFYYETFFKNTKKLYLLSGIFLGLSLSIKITSLSLLPFVGLGFLYKLLQKPQEKKLLVLNYLSMLMASTIPILLGYFHFFYKSGIITSVRTTFDAVRETYVTKSAEGKVHVIDGIVYEKSPWWTYISYYIKVNGLFRLFVITILSLVSMLKKNFFVYYWGAFFALVLIFHQISGVKNVRYVSSIEIPLIILAVAGLNYVFTKFKKTKGLLFATVFVIMFFVFTQVAYITSLGYTEYEGLYRYFKNETKEFTEYKRMFVFGSVRSLKYYRELVPDAGMLLWRRDYEVMCPEFDSFDYFAFDKEELLKNPDNFMYLYVKANIEDFVQVPQILDMHVFKRIRSFESRIKCPEIEIKE